MALHLLLRVRRRGAHGAAYRRATLSVLRVSRRSVARGGVATDAAGGAAIRRTIAVSRMCRCTSCMVPRSTADAVRGTVTCVVVGVWSTLVPSSELPHKFGYYAVVAVFLLGLRFGVRAIGMFFVACVALGIANATARTPCGLNHYQCGFDAAEPFLIFGYLIFPTIAGALVSGVFRLSGTVAPRTLRRTHDPPHEQRMLSLGPTASIALGAAATAFAGFAALPLSGAPLFLPSIAACVAFGLAPSSVESASLPESDSLPAPSGRAEPWWPRENSYR